MWEALQRKGWEWEGKGHELVHSGSSLGVTPVFLCLISLGLSDSLVACLCLRIVPIKLESIAVHLTKERILSAALGRPEAGIS